LLNQLEMEAEVILILLIKLIINETDAGENLAGWMRVARDGDLRSCVRLPSTVYLISGTLAYW
jgi:hypothetical protein